MDTGVLGDFVGYPVISTVYMSHAVQARKHRKKRINKKWLKRYGMRQVPYKHLVLCDGKVYGHPDIISKLIAEINQI